MLNYETYGENANPGLLIVHGLFGSGRNWRAIAKRLSSEFQVTTVDMRNHAGSFWSDEMSYPAMATDLSEIIEVLGSPMMVAGHSMGGKAAMILALSRSDLVSRLIVADIAPVAYAHDQTSFIDAMMAVDLLQIQKRSDVNEALRESVEDPALRSFFAQSIEIGENDARWLLNLKVLKREMHKIVGWPDVSGQYRGNTLFVAGTESDYVTAAGRTVIKDLFPHARHTKLKQAGHWLHADQPRAFVETVRAFCTAPTID